MQSGFEDSLKGEEVKTIDTCSSEIWSTRSNSFFGNQLYLLREFQNYLTQNLNGRKSADIYYASMKNEEQIRWTK